jgi:predicted negative regulator of RcsB-dependent stress response
MEANAPRSAGIYDFLGWCDKNKQRLVMFAGIAVVAGLIIGFVVWQRGQREINAEHELSSIRVPFSPSEPLAPGTGDALAKIADEYSGTAAAAKATLRAGTSYFAEKNYAKAREQFDKILRSYADSPWVPQAVYGLAAVAEAEGKAPEAITKYNDFATKYAGDPAVDQARLSMARLYEQTKQPAQALDVLKKMTEGQAGGFGPGASEAQEKMRAIYAKHPELLPPPPVNPATFNQVFSNMPQVMQTNTIALSNLISRTNLPGATGAAPRIVLPNTPATPGK